MNQARTPAAPPADGTPLGGSAAINRQVVTILLENPGVDVRREPRP